MNSDKYNRKIEMMCPACGCTQFEVNQVNEENPPNLVDATSRALMAGAKEKIK